jgi:hypothetical protein
LAELGHDKKPYVRGICEISGITVWLVDGEYVRKNICEDFVNYDHHHHLKFIPENEFWIAEGTSEEEIEFYTDRMLIEHRLISSGMGYDDACKKAANFEKRERAKSEMIKKLGQARENKQELIERVHKELLDKYSGRVKVWVVNGELVRSLFYTDFGGGGHDKVYHFIPDNEIWIDDDIAPEERKFIVLHELHERNLMSGGMDYPKAHKSATRVEDLCRHKTGETDDAISEEIKKQELPEKKG